ncbi:hypothetical protein EYF80_034958 [Liparis tanakae]|uniref:Uncharacterized protein n=1 Tax=Liparis tanakae TaxID=230148 RepID=A0A4Z2GND0_9TELE|nr:hypothetical protein EYF80_034958 [Liparis tanakae]
MCRQVVQGPRKKGDMGKHGGGTIAAWVPVSPPGLGSKKRKKVPWWLRLSPLAWTPVVTCDFVFSTQELRPQTPGPRPQVPDPRPQTQAPVDGSETPSVYISKAKVVA